MKKAITIFIAVFCCINGFTMFANDSSIESSNSYFNLYNFEYNRKANTILADMIDYMAIGMAQGDNGRRNNQPVYVTLTDGTKFTMVPFGGRLSIGLTPAIKKALVTSDFKSAYFYQHSNNEGKFEFKFIPGSTAVFKKLGLQENSSNQSSGSSSRPRNSTGPAKMPAPTVPKANLPKCFNCTGYIISPISLGIKTNIKTNRKYLSIIADVSTTSKGFTYICYFLDQNGNQISVPKGLKLPDNLRDCITYIAGRRTVANKIRGYYRAEKAAVGGTSVYLDAFRQCNPVPTGVYCVIDLYDDSEVLKARQVSPYLRLF